jgi:caa(3)-type oxidase subunit IV
MKPITAHVTEEHSPSIRSVHGAAIALFVLWGASFISSYAQLGRWALPLALAIACAKALVVLLVFMELWGARFSIKAALLAAVALVAVFMLFSALDVGTREPPPLQPPPAS